MTATRDFLESTSNEFNQAVIRAKEAVTDQKSLRIATRCRQVLEDAWTKYNSAYAQYAAKLKEPASKAEAQALWLGEMRSYEASLDALEEYLENLQGEPGNAQGKTAVLLAKEAVAAAVQEALRRQGSLDAQLSKEMNTKQAAFLQEEIARMRRDLGNKLQAAYAGLIQASADADKVKAAKERAAELTEVNKKLDESLEVLRQQVRVEERATAPRADYIAESVTAAVDEDEDVDVDVDEDEDDCDIASKLGFEATDDEDVEAEGGTVKTAAQKKKEKKAKQLQKLKEEKVRDEGQAAAPRTEDIAESVTAAVTASMKQEKEEGTEIKEEEAKSKKAEKRKVVKEEKEEESTSPSRKVSPCLANMVPKPQPTPPRNDPGRFLQAYIFPWKILNINNIREDGIEICTGLLTEEIRA